jgi:hypothetical protein
MSLICSGVYLTLISFNGMNPNFSGGFVGDPKSSVKFRAETRKRGEYRYGKDRGRYVFSHCVCDFSFF